MDPNKLSEPHNNSNTPPKISPDQLSDIRFKKKLNTQDTVQDSSLREKQPRPSSLDDKTTDKAIDDIVINESNQVLAIEDAKERKEAELNPKPKKGFSFNKIFKNKWFYIALPIIILIIIFAVPYSRYATVGLVIKKQYQFTIIDSKTNSLVGGAIIKVGGQTLTTSPKGKATVNLKVGPHAYTITKHLYQSAQGHILVGVIKKNTEPIKIIATGRQVEIQVTNKLTGKPIAGADIKVLNSSSSTNSKGQTFLVLPTKADAYLAKITALGFNSQTTSVSLLKKINTYTMVPSGNLAFLTNTNGIINVVKANLDGSNPEILVAGTGHEAANTTSLIPSPDWKYLLLRANRNGTQPELYIINSLNGNIVEFDSSPDQFKLIGWNNDTFIYDEINTSQATNVTGRELLKSYDAQNSKLNILDQNQVNSTGSGYAYQTFSSFNLVANEVIYYTNWTVSGSYDISTLNSTIRGVQAIGINKNDFQTFPASTTGAVSIVRNAPSSLYISVLNTSTNQTSYYQYMNGAVSANNSLTASNMTKKYPVYYISPSGSQSLWTDPNLPVVQTFTGDQNDQSPKLLNVPTGYIAYSWFDNIYMLLSKDSQLYVVTIDGSASPTLIGTYMPSAV